MQTLNVDDTMKINLGLIGNVTHTNNFIEHTFKLFKNIHTDENSDYIHYFHLISNSESIPSRENIVYKLIECNMDISELATHDINEFIKGNSLDFIIFFVDMTQMYKPEYIDHITNTLSNLDIIKQDTKKNIDTFLQFVIMNDSDKIEEDLTRDTIGKILNTFSINYEKYKQFTEYFSIDYPYPVYDPTIAMVKLIETYKLFLFPRSFHFLDFQDNPYRSNEDTLKNLYSCINIWIRSRNYL